MLFTRYRGWTKKVQVNAMHTFSWYIHTRTYTTADGDRQPVDEKQGTSIKEAFVFEQPPLEPYRTTSRYVGIYPRTKKGTTQAMAVNTGGGERHVFTALHNDDTY